MSDHRDTGPETPMTGHDAPHPGAGAGDGAVERTSRGALVIPAVLVVLGVFLVVGTTTMQEAGDGGLFGARTFPWIVAALCFATAVAMTIDTLRPRRRPSTATAGGGAAGTDINWRAVGTTVGGVLFFILTLQFLGWILAGTLLFAIVAIGLGSRSYLTCVLVGLALASIIQLVFSGYLGVSLPAGIIGGI